ncbi:MAG: hypothetical protein ACT4PV_00790 [Planctomycetaceae bacterium]
MDFWAQHKEFVLKVLAGLGVFLVALIARGIVFGDELTQQKSANDLSVRKIKAARLLPLNTISGLEERAKSLRDNTKQLAARIGHDGSAGDLELTLLQRTLSYLRRNESADPAALRAEARASLDALREDLNGGFGQLKGMLRDELLEEASERNVRIEKTGFESVTNIEAGELPKYLLQLELVARVIRYSIDARMGAVEEIRIDSSTDEVVFGANPDYLREFTVLLRLFGSERAANEVLNRLQTIAPDPPVRRIALQRRERQRGGLELILELCATAVEPAASYAKPEGSQG